jgi:DNA polymerase-3 subunit gamma/tau
MSYKVLSLKWRPQTFDDIVGQDHVTKTLINAFKLDRVAQGYMFTGPRGVGKTTTARILSRALNAEGGEKYDFDPTSNLSLEIAEGRALDVLEIDGASNRGIEEIRNLREQIKFAPMVGNYKIIIIDEVHMLTNPAFNALLRTLEEPPAHGKFIFCTTDIHKVPATIISRCQRFDFNRISTDTIISRISFILDEESIS